MKIDVKELKKEAGLIQNVVFQEDVLLPEAASPVKVGAEARVCFVGNSLVLFGNATASVSMECDRCLEPFLYPLNVSFEEEFLESSDIQEKTCYDGRVLDLTETIRQNLLTHFPMHPLCSSGCKGLCPKCGSNLNKKTCQCSIKEIDPRFEVLKKLLKES